MNAAPLHADHPLRAHSTAEAGFYLMLMPCPTCGAGRLEEHARAEVSRHIDVVIDLTARCHACKATCAIRFRIDPDASCSELVDVAQWLTLAHGFMTSPQKTPAADRARKLQAAMCLDEALKFYHEDNDLPPDDAFFDPERRSRALDNPRPFLRTVLLDARRRLPSGTAGAE